jgi:DNA-nicking Smr family endonuclease
VIDVAHGGEDREDAMRKVIKGIEVSLGGNHKGLKVIHGHGSRPGHTGIIRDQVVRLLQKEAKRLKARLVKDRDNPGAHILYFG